MGWVILATFAPIPVKIVAIAANLLAFGVFAFLLRHDLLPGESIDWIALSFAWMVFAIYCWTNFYWRPWRRRG